MRQITLDLEPFRVAMHRMSAVVVAVNREFRAFTATLNGKHELAQVIREQPGRQIVREGLADILHWLGECECSTPCEYARERD